MLFYRVGGVFRLSYRVSGVSEKDPWRSPNGCTTKPQHCLRGMDTSKWKPSEETVAHVGCAAESDRAQCSFVGA